MHFYLESLGGLAYEHLPANTVIEGVTFPETDVTGLTIDYSVATHSGACQQVYSDESIDYTQGYFIVNEGWYGHENAHVTFITNDGQPVYRVLQKENPGVELGCTAPFGTIYGGKFFVTSKQDQDPGATVQGGRFSVFDATTLKLEKQFPVIAADENGKSVADGRSFLGVSEHKGYIGTSNGIYPYDIDAQTIGAAIEGTGGGTGLYSNQVGTMVRVNDRVFAVHQKNGLMVIDPESDQVEQTITVGENGWTFGSAVLSKDGSLWCSVAASNGSGQAGTYMVKVNPATLDTLHVSMPSGIYGPANSWYAWTPDCFCASTQHNVLYWNGGQSSWLSAKTIFKYDIDNNAFSTYLDFNGEAWQIYGASFRIDPVTDEAVVSLFKSYGSTDYVVRRYDNQGTMQQETPLSAHYWFPSSPVFPDNAEPVAAEPEMQTVTGAEPVTVSLAEIATDADNMQAAMVKTVKAVSDATVLSAEVVNGNLVITPLGDGHADITLQVNSNGRLVFVVVPVSVTTTVGIDAIEADAAAKIVYDMQGRRMGAATAKGICIVNGKKVVMK